jgi:anti-sigma regulatory factor (Ser/Thr protein kinase)
MGFTMPSARRTFARAAAAAAEARRFLCGHLARWGLESSRPALELAMSELVTNAVTHGRGAVEVALRCADGFVRVDVTDHGGGHPAMRPAGGPRDAIGGWGLRLVDEVADDWGTDVSEGRTTVWLRLRVPGCAPRLEAAV